MPKAEVQFCSGCDAFWVGMCISQYQLAARALISLDKVANTHALPADAAAEITATGIEHLVKVHELLSEDSPHCGLTFEQFADNVDLFREIVRLAN